MVVEESQDHPFAVLVVLLLCSDRRKTGVRNGAGGDLSEDAEVGGLFQGSVYGCISAGKIDSVEKNYELSKIVIDDEVLCMAGHTCWTLEDYRSRV